MQTHFNISENKLQCAITDIELECKIKKEAKMLVQMLENNLC